MITNIPTPNALNEVSLRLYFDAWSSIVVIISNFECEYESNFYPWSKDSEWTDEWKHYIEQAQPELGTILAIAQQSAEIRLKSIICETSPFLLLLKSGLNLKENGTDLNFADLKTLDAAELPAAVNTLTPFKLNNDYIETYQKLRRLRNKVIHVGGADERLKPTEIIELLTKQYASLWPDGRWLYRRVQFDGNSSTRFFHDGRYSSPVSIVMSELPTTIELFEDRYFKNCFGYAKSKITGHCPNCKAELASKLGYHSEPTVVQTAEFSAKCLMCENVLQINKRSETCTCQSESSAVFNKDSCCYDCGNW